MSKTKNIDITREVFDFVIKNPDDITLFDIPEFNDKIRELNDFVKLCIQKANVNCNGEIILFDVFKIDIFTGLSFLYIVGEYTLEDAAFLRKRKNSIKNGELKNEKNI